MIKKILLKGYYGRGNFGDDALLMSAVKLIGDVFCENDPKVYLEQRSNVKYLSAIIGIELHPYSSKVGVDLIIYGGGTQFFSFTKISRTDKIKFWIGEFRRRPILTLFEIIKRLRSRYFISISKNHQSNDSVKPLIAMVGVGFGPQEDSDSEKKSLEMVNASSVITVRDKFSFEYLRSVISTKKVYQTSDLCYLHFREMCSRIAGERSRAQGKGSHKELQLGIILRDWKWLNGDFNSEVVDTVLSCIEGNWKAKVFVFSADEDQSIKKICDEKGLESEVWLSDDNNSFEKYIRKLADCDRVISSRYHGLVFSALLGIPHLALSIDRKLSAHKYENQDLCSEWYPSEGFKKLRTCIYGILDKTPKGGAAVDQLNILYSASLDNVNILKNEFYEK